MRNYFVVRFLIDDNVFNDLREELLKGHLRIPWGFAGLDLRNKENFVAAYVERSKENNHEMTEEELTNEAVNRYSRLLILTKIKIGDIILIPKVSIHQSEVGKFFTIAEVSAEYSFEPMPKHNDFGHIIGVKLLNTFNYHSENMAASYIGNNLVSAFRSRIVSRINNPDMIRCVEELLGSLTSHETGKILVEPHEKEIFLAPPRKSSGYSIIDQILAMQESYLEGLLKLLRNLPPDDPSHNEISQKVLEALRMFSTDELIKIVKKLFVNNGHRLLDDESIFLIFELFPERELMHDFCKSEESRKVFVCIKTRDTSYETVFAQFDKNDNGHIRILIDLTAQFDAEIAAKAAERSVILIDGLTFANILARHQISDNRIV